MLLPFTPLPQKDKSTSYVFSKAMKDLDKAITQEKPWYFTHAVYLNIPIWSLGEFYYRFRKSTSSPQGDIEVYDESTTGSFPELEALDNSYINPNLVIPLLFQYYTENIIRQKISNTGSEETEEYITEIAFWKTLRLMGLDPTDLVTYVSDISTASFVEVDNSTGWSQIVAAIPPQTSLPQISFKTIQDVDSLVIAEDNNDNSIYDSDQQGYAFVFNSEDKQVLDFTSLTYDTTTQTELSFNIILLYYTDDSGIEKLHSVDFIHPFKLTPQGYSVPSSSFVTNTVNSFGYTFNFNVKSCGNQASRDIIIARQDGEFYSVFEHVMSDFDSFLKLHEKDFDPTKRVKAQSSSSYVTNATTSSRDIIIPQITEAVKNGSRQYTEPW